MADRPSPHSIAVCTLIALQSDPKSVLLGVSTGGREVDAHLSALLQRLVLPSDSFECMSLAELLDLVAGDESRRFSTVADALLQDLQQTCASIDALIDFFAALRSILAKGRVDGVAIHGMYMRQHCLGFDLLHFESVTRLWTALYDYVHQNSYNNFAQAWPLSERQIIMHLTAQCLNIQQKAGEVAFEPLEHLLQQILTVHPELIVAHFLRYLNCYLHHEKIAALEHLHRYFDYAMIAERKDLIVHGANATTPHPMRNILQYAPILLSSMFHRFGHGDLALKASEEALRIAQQTGDGTCMAYASAWLQVLQSTSTVSQHTMMNLSPSPLTQASSHHQIIPHPCLFPATCLLQAQHALTHGVRTITSNHRGAEHKEEPLDFSLFISPKHSRVIPSLAFDYVAAASVFDSPMSQDKRYTSLNQSIIPSNNFSSDSPSCITNLQDGTDACQTFIRQGFTTSALWAALGHFTLAQAHSNLISDVYSDLVSTDQASEAALQSAVIKSRYGPGFYNDDTEARTVPGALHLYCQSFRLNEIAAHQGDWLVTKTYRHRMYNSLPVIFKYGMDYLIDAMGSASLLLIRQKKYDEAKILLNQICMHCEHHSLHSRHAYYLLQQSLMYISMNDPIGAFPSLLTCLTLCDSKLLDSMHAAALSVLARVFYHMEDERCKPLLKSVIPRLIQHGMTYFVAEAWLLLAKCTLVERNHDSLTQRIDLRKTLSHLSESEVAFRFMEDRIRLCEIYYLKSHVYHRLGETTKRNVEARRFHEMKKRLDSSLFPSWVYRPI